MTKQFAGYAITETLRRGEHAVLYRAKREADQRSVLIKTVADPRSVARAGEHLRNETEVSRLLDLACVVSTVASDASADTPYIVLEDFGTTLDELTRKGPMPVAAFLPLAARIARALAEIHDQGIIHRDLKPEHVALSPDHDVVKITGFGVASQLDREQPAPVDPRLIAGTLEYMSPEQTGRMNRSVDARSDLYSLGVTFFEMLAGALPFRSSDALGFVHHHIAHEPPPLHELRPEIPHVVSAIVSKLLAKMSEDRYQSALGLAKDLERAEDELTRRGVIEPFPLGAEDVSRQFRLPQQLYGREAEVLALVRAFERVVSAGRREVVLVAGYSGIGKTALVQELYRPIVRTRGYFISGKFDQYKRGVPYAIITQAFGDLVKQLLTESDERIRVWRTRLTEALGINAQLVIDVVPELGRILGEQPPVPDVSLSEAQTRFLFVFQRFVRVFAEAEHPLVLFLDDLQWVDPASLELIEHLVLDDSTRYVLLVGAYRDNEVNAAHPLARTLDGLAKGDVSVELLTPGPLTETHIAWMIGAATHRPSAEVTALAALISAKTGGNPFFVIQLLMSLHREGLLRFDARTLTFRWELPAIEAKGYTDNVIDLVAGRMLKLPEEARRMLEIAAALGNRVDTHTLATLSGQSLAETRRILRDPLREGLVLAQEETHFAFLHDRVQQAAYSLLREEERPALHLRIARMLTSSFDEPELAEHLFEILEHFEAARSLVTGEEERKRVGLMSLNAADKALRSTAYSDGLRFAERARALLEPLDWHGGYELTRALYGTLAEAEFLNGHPARSEALIREALAHVRTPVEKAELMNLLIVGQTLEGDYRAAVTLGLDALSMLGVDMRSDDPARAFDAAVVEIDALMAGRRPAELIALPRLTDPIYQAAQKILLSIEVASYIGVIELYMLIVAKMVKISLTHGNSIESCKNYGIYGLALGHAKGRYAQGYEFAELGKALIDHLGASEIKCKLHWPFTVAKAWVSPIRQTFGSWQEGILAGRTTGDIQFTAYLHSTEATYHFIAGDRLTEMHAQIVRGQEVARSLGNRWAMETLEALGLSVAALRFGRGLEERSPEEQAFLADTTTHDADSALCLYHTFRAQRAILHGDPAAALEHAEIAESLTDKILFVMVCVDATFYAALAQCALLAGLGPSDPRAGVLAAGLASNEEKLATWQSACRANTEHKALLVRAEAARARGDELVAMRSYDAAASAARENGFVQDEGLAHLLASRFYEVAGLPDVSASRLRSARACFERWGADALIATLERAHPAAFDVADSSRARASSGVERLDVLSVTKATQAISSKIVLADLLRTLVPIVVENAGAQRGVLLRPAGDTLTIAAEAEQGGVEVTLAHARSLTPRDAIAASLVTFVKRTGETVLLDDAVRSSLFGSDPYIARRMPKSVLCVPIVRQGKVVGIFYLENNLATHVFSADRVAFVELLAGQAAVSLENAALYADLEKLAEELRQAQRMEAIGRLAGGVAHDFNNVLAVVDLCAGLLARGGGDPKDLAREIQQASDRAAELTRQLLAFSRRQVLKPQPLDLNAVVTGLERMLRRLLGADIAIHVHAAGDLHVVHADLGQVEQVIVNLAVNARDAMPNGGRLTLETDNVVLDEAYARHYPNVVPGEYVVLRVTDTGSGMDGEVKLRIFEPFFTTKEVGKGTGLGLSTVYGIVKQSGGHIVVESEPGAGTAFEIFLPRAQASRPRAGASERPAPGGEVVLLVEEDAMVRSFAARSLERCGYRVIEATGGREALEVCENVADGISMLVTNVVLGGIHGRELAQRVVSRWPTTRVLFVSPYAEESIVRHGVLERRACFLRQPFTAESLVRAVRDGLEA